MIAFLKRLWDMIFAPDVPEPAPVFTDDVDILKFHWRGPCAMGAKVVCSLSDVHRDGGNLHYKKGKRNWKLNDACDSYSCLFVSRNGGETWDGGKFDWSRPNESMRPLNHMVEGGYLDNRYPSATPILPPIHGETWAYLEISLDLKERTEIRTFKW